MKRQEYNHDAIEGSDVDIETSLKEYGIAWIHSQDDILFYYGIEYGPEEDESGCLFDCWIKFDFCTVSKDIDVFGEYDWADWDGVLSFVGMTKEEFSEMTLPQQILVLMSYYGSEEIFGSGYWEGLTYNEIFK